MATSRSWVDEQEVVEEQIRSLALPDGVRFREIKPMTESTGEDAWDITFSVSKQKQLTKAFLRELGQVREDLSDRIFALRLGKWPFITFKDGQ